MSSTQILSRLKARLQHPELVADIRFPPYPSLPPPVSELQLQRAELRLGFKLPALLRQLYLRVADGGFGPGYGLIGLQSGPGIYGLHLVDLYLEGVQTQPPEGYQPWPVNFIQICEWGDGITSALDWTIAGAPVFRVRGDWYEGGPWEPVITAEAPSLLAWFKVWLE